jgi:anti-sigma regulatory factor (Ser/Thr protein kinase)
MDENAMNENAMNEKVLRAGGDGRWAKTFLADVHCLDAVQDFVRGRMEESGIAHDAAGRVELAVEEVFVNIALYAYNESASGGEVTVRCRVGPEILSLEFVDEGLPFNPLEREDPDITLTAWEREPGGLGLFIVKKIMDAVEYRREGKKNVLRMSKRMAPRTPCE